MGIPRLGAHVQNNCKPTPVSVRDIDAVIFDGDGLVWARGGDAGVDYAEVAQKVTKTLWKLRDKCEVCFDGFSGGKKERTTWKRQMQKVAMADDSYEQRLPAMSLVKRAVKAKLHDSGIPIWQSWGEADQEISSRSLHKHALVVGDDSDFHIMAYQYLRLSMLTPNNTIFRITARRDIWVRLGLPRESFLPLLPLLAGNDYIPEPTLRAVRKCTGKEYTLRGFTEFLSENRDKTAEELMREMALKAAVERAAVCAGNDEMVEEFRRTYLRDMYESYNSFCLVGFEPKKPRAGLPQNLVECYERGGVGAELAGLFVGDERPTFWLPVLFEDGSLPSVHSHTVDLRRKAYAVGLDRQKVVREYYACSEALVHTDKEVVPCDSFSLHTLWADVPAQLDESERRQLFAHFLPYIDDELYHTVTNTRQTWLRTAYLVAAVMMQYSAVTLTEVEAVFCGLVACGSEVLLGSDPWGETRESHHLGSIFRASLNALLVANDVVCGVLIPQIPCDIRWVRGRILSYICRQLTLGRKRIHDMVVHEQCLLTCSEGVEMLRARFPRERYVARHPRKGEVMEMGKYLAGYKHTCGETVCFTAMSYLALVEGLVSAVEAGSIVLVESSSDARAVVDHMSTTGKHYTCLTELPTSTHFPASLATPRDTIVIVRAAPWLLSASEISIRAYTKPFTSVVFFQIDPPEEFLCMTSAPVSVFQQDAHSTHSTLVEIS